MNIIIHTYEIFLTYINIEVKYKYFLTSEDIQKEQNHNILKKSRKTINFGGWKKNMEK